VIISNLLSIYAGHIRTIWPVKYADYDAVLSGTTYNDLILEIDTNNIDEFVGFSMPMWYARFIKGNKSYSKPEEEGIPSILGASSNKNSLITAYEMLLKGCIIDKDESLFSLENGIFISDKIAVEIGAKVGDKIKLQLPINPGKVSDQEKINGFDNDLIYDFVVAAIYRAPFVSLSFIDIEMYHKIGKDYLIGGGDDKYFMYMNHVYIKFINTDAGLKELESFRSTPISMYLEHGDNWRDKIKENEFLYKIYLESAGKGFEKHSTLLKYAEKYSTIDTRVVVFYALAASIAISLLFISKNTKAINTGMKSFGVLSASGMPSKTFFIYFVLTTFIEQTVLLVLVHLGKTLFFIYRNDTWFYYMTNSFVRIRIYFPIIIGIVLSSLFTGIYAKSIISKRKILSALSSE
jgi:hypothetical protein